MHIACWGLVSPLKAWGHGVPHHQFQAGNSEEKLHGFLAGVVRTCVLWVFGIFWPLEPHGDMFLSILTLEASLKSCRYLQKAYLRKQGLSKEGSNGKYINPWTN